MRQAALRRLLAGCVLPAVRSSCDFLFPRQCPQCSNDGRTGSAESLYPRLCSSCASELAPVIPHSCGKCGAPVGPFLDTSGGCIHCRKDRFAFDGVFRLGVYENVLRAACLTMKEPAGQPLAAAVAGLLFERERTALEACRADVIVPVPHHWTHRVRPFSRPPETLARVLAHSLQGEFSAHILAKVRNTPTQASLPPSLRRTNLRGAFRVGGSVSLAGRSILLVDDILTTGTTANEASKTLRRAGATRVNVAVIARGLGRS